jgi:hypothetical protein
MDSPLSSPVNLTEGILPNLPTDWAVEPDTHRITLPYDPVRHGVLICRTILATGVNLNYWLSLKTGGLFPETYPTNAGVYSAFNYLSGDRDTQHLILGCNDGYMRIFSDSAKDDDNGDTDSAITSHVTLPLIQAEEDDESLLLSLTINLAGGASGGDFSDTDGVTYQLYTADDAETVLEDIKDGASARESGTLSGTGRQNRIRKRVRGRAIALRLINSTASETWAIEKITGKLKPAGDV